MEAELNDVRDLSLSCQLELNRLGDAIARAIQLLPSEMQDEVDPDRKYRQSPYEKYLEMMRDQPGPMNGLNIKDDPAIDS